MMSTLLNHQHELSAKHRANIAASLAHRLNRARAARNFQLLSLLEQEQQQLNQRQLTQTTLPTLTQWGKAVWNRFVNATISCPAISIQAITGDSGDVIWRAYNPTTGETRYAETEAEVIDWVESQQYWGYAATASLPCCRSRSISSSR